jgi:hypothetical protein
MVSALFAMTSKIGQIAMVNPATSKTGTSEVITLAVFGWLLTKFCSGLMNPAIFDKDERAQSSETGKI